MVETTRGVFGVQGQDTGSQSQIRHPLFMREELQATCSPSLATKSHCSWPRSYCSPSPVTERGGAFVQLTMGLPLEGAPHHAPWAPTLFFGVKCTHRRTWAGRARGHPCYTHSEVPSSLRSFRLLLFHLTGPRITPSDKPSQGKEKL